ncbi:MAG TPA: M4 family metallopeptidase [Acidimicrobiales bacterium]|nr:M4 family metallopeptidase [Acidimicrobiales bacterium]
MRPTHLHRHRSSLACIVPPDLLRDIIRNGTEEERWAAADTMAIDTTFRTLRAAFAATVAATKVAMLPMGGQGGQPQRTIYDQKNSNAIALGTVARTEGQPAVRDPAVNEAYDGFGATYKFFWEVLGRNSIDNAGMPILGLVHYSTNYANAFWDGQGHMFFGDGDGRLFVRLTKSVDVIGHELAHGVTQYEANLVYQGQSGALNESMSDVFGSLVKQYAKNQTANKADWLIGKDVVGPTLKPALRSMKAPGTANAYDKQPANMDKFVYTAADNGGVHINSGIPNHAFYVAATTMGGKAWEKAGRIWYDSLRDAKIRPTSGFKAFARATVRQAQIRFGATAPEVDAVRAGWDKTKVKM